MTINGWLKSSPNDSFVALSHWFMQRNSSKHRCPRQSWRGLGLAAWRAKLRRHGIITDGLCWSSPRGRWRPFPILGPPDLEQIPMPETSMSVSECSRSDVSSHRPRPHTPPWWNEVHTLASGARANGTRPAATAAADLGPSWTREFYW